MKRKPIVKILVLISILCLTFAISGCSNKTSEEVIVKANCNNGIMLGKEVDGIQCWKGIPYATPPVDDLRWKAPVAVSESSDEVECYDFGYTAIQYEWPTEPASYNEKSEDCLTLNVWAASDDKKKKPVMVYVHGGSAVWGGTSDPMYDGNNFVTAHPEVIMITINYRLGVMAWADFTDIPGGEEYNDLNLGIRDQICALQWIKENVAAFGGDPNNITIFGESAGSSSVASLMVSPLADGLFNKAIMQSTKLTVNTRDDAKAFADAMVEASGAKNMEDLLAITGEEWIALDEEFGISDISPGTVVDNEVIPENYNDAFAESANKGYSLMLGTNADEYNYAMCEMPDFETFEKWVENIWDTNYDAIPEGGQELMDEFLEIQMENDDTDELWAKVEFINECRSRIPMIKHASGFADAGGDVYMYYWNVPSTLDKYHKGACHAVELAYMFGNTSDTIYTGKTDIPTAEKAMEAWANFAITGNPSSDNSTWEKYDSEKRNTMVINLDKWEMVLDPLKEQREVLFKLFENYELPTLIIV